MKLKIFGRNVLEFNVSNTPAPKELVPVETNAKNIAPSEEPPITSVPKLSNGYERIYTHVFNGEKNLGEMGPAKEYYCDHDTLRTRSWQLFLESEICQTVFKAYDRWTIGSGLKLQSEPQTDVLKSEKLNIDIENFNDMVESRFSVYSESKMGDYANMRNIHKIASRAFKNSIIGGDVLVVLRVAGQKVTVQLIDGAHLGTPSSCQMSGSDYVYINGNKVKHGVEVNDEGMHIAYHVRTGMLSTERILARGKNSGRLMAFLVYGLEYRLDSVRGIPLVCAVMETAKKMDRYKEATLGSAEERQKIPYTIEHSEISDGSNPLLERMASAMGAEASVATYDGEQLARNVAATTNKQVLNMPQGATLKSIDSKNELYFGDFFSVNIMMVCATIGIPKDVAMMLYTSNYSASRAAIKDWEHSLTIQRKDFADQFYKNIYALWLDVQVFANKIEAPGYLNSLYDNNEMAIEAYRHARWVGANVPHIDPLKEVLAEREKLGEGSKHIPLTTIEAATEALNGGESWSNFNQYARELKKATELGIEKVEKTPSATPLEKSKSAD